MQIPQTLSVKGFAGNEIGGDKGIRTPDLLHAKQPLSQLSYTPDEIIIAYFSEVIKYFGKIFFEK